MNSTDLKQRLASYFGNGGLFNPEMMEHDKVRDLLRDCRSHIEELEQDYPLSLNSYVEKISQLQSQLREREADCAAKRDALLKIGNQFREDDDIVPVYSLCKQATSSDAGKELLDRLQAVEAERDRLRTHVIEFLNDWKKGDFQLSELAACDARAMEEALQPAQKEQK